MLTIQTYFVTTSSVSLPTNVVSAKSKPKPGRPKTAADNTSFSYDLLGRRTAANKTGYPIGYAWDNAGRLTAATAGTKTLSYQYDPAGNRIRTTWPEATPFYITRTYDALNRPAAILENGVTALASYAYDDLSRAPPSPWVTAPPPTPATTPSPPWPA